MKFFRFVSKTKNKYYKFASSYYDRKKGSKIATALLVLLYMAAAIVSAVFALKFFGGESGTEHGILIGILLSVVFALAFVSALEQSIMLAMVGFKTYFGKIIQNAIMNKISQTNAIQGDLQFDENKIVDINENGEIQKREVEGKRGIDLACGILGIVFLIGLIGGTIAAVALCMKPSLIWWPIVAIILIAFAKGMGK